MNSLYKTTAQKRWTKTAINCYFLGCVCPKCPIFDILGRNCRMKGTVLELVRLYGKPKNIQISSNRKNNRKENKMCKGGALISIPASKQETIKEATPADASATKASAIEREKSEGLAGRDTKTGARGLGEEAKSKKKTLLGE